MNKPFSGWPDPTLEQRVERRLMTRDEYAMAAFDFYIWLEKEGYEDVKRRFIESGLMDGRKP